MLEGDIFKINTTWFVTDGMNSVSLKAIDPINEKMILISQFYNRQV